MDRGYKTILMYNYDNWDRNENNSNDNDKT